MKTGQLFIDGKWVETKDKFNQINPDTGNVFGLVCNAGVSEVDSAVNSALQAIPKWSAMPVHERASIVKKAADILIEMYGDEGQPTELKSLISEEMGKRLPEADIEVIESSDMAAYYAENGERLLSDEQLKLNSDLWPTKQSVVEYEPIGVVGIIKAWNYPLEIPIWSIAPALISGNTIVFKPSEHSSFTGLEIGKIFQKAGLPDGVLNVVTGNGATGEYITQHKDVKLIDFTGSVATGKKIASTCAVDLKKCTLELGGNDAAVVLEDANIELTSNGLVWGAFCNSGQVCVGVKRVLINDTLKTTLVDALVEKTNNLVAGRDYGPVISESQLSEIQSFVDDAVQKGATILTGGKRNEEKSGWYYLPTILTGLSPDMRIVKEECFGPLLPISFIKDFEEGISLANDSTFGLGASVWTTDNEKGISMARRLEAGMVWVNDVNVAFPEAPWGGRKNSGIGIALSDKAIYEYVVPKHISIEKSEEERRVWWYPYT